MGIAAIAVQGDLVVLFSGVESKDGSCHRSSDLVWSYDADRVIRAETEGYVFELIQYPLLETLEDEPWTGTPRNNIGLDSEAHMNWPEERVEAVQVEQLQCYT